MTQAATAIRIRRTQADRTASTRARLLDATIACLNDLGYAGTTTPEIARRAGVSRGAQLHHFPTKIELVTAAVEHLFGRRHQEFVDAFARLPESADRPTAGIDLLWSIFAGETFHAWLELAVAARTDAELRQHLKDTTDRLMATVGHTFRELFAPPSTPNPFYDIAPEFVFALLDGLALHRISGGADDTTGQVLDGLKAIARLVMPPSV
ncbi:MAG TPA: TetR/AcrR family transcriptional regulator [Candidatus Binatia bacterium]|nr:TetR/AcrR family transcriptional regulator [Candidatus Binatia bacterium]